LVELGFVTDAQFTEALARRPDRVSEALVELGHITQGQLRQALAAVKSTTRPRLGDVLIDRLHITPERLEHVLQLQASGGEARHLGELLVETGECTYEQVFEALRIQSSSASTTKQHRVMVVDDSLIVCSVLTQGLMDLGYDVVSFEDPVRALAELAAVQPDLVVSDLEMPNLDGAQLCRRLKEISQGQLPVIILTANESETAIAGLEAGADDYVRKGTSMEELGARIGTILRRTNETSRVRRMFARYTSDAVVDQVLQATDVVLTGEKRDVTVLFADIRSFTSFAETQSPDRVVTTLNDILGQLADAVLAHGGTIDKFLGDGLMAVFGAPMRLSNDPARALAAATQMLAAAAARNTTCSPELRLDIGVAINTGPVVAGSIGNERRTEYTCIGDTVNVASRLCSIGDAGDILVGAGTVDRIIAESSGDRTRFEEMAPVHLKGKAQPTRVFRAKPPV
jgi:adenylate cyclase